MRSSPWLVAAVVILAVSITSGQVATGVPQYGSFGGGPFDTVNLGNLNVHFGIPILNKAGRGMPFAYNLGYDSSVWTPVVSNGVKQWQPASNWGWASSYEAGFGYVVQTSGSGSGGCIDQDGIQRNYSYTYWWTSGYGDQYRVFHPAYVATYSYSPTAAACGINIIASRSGTATTSDGSGYTLSVYLGTVTVTSPSGRVIAAPIQGAESSGTYTDANGNQITENSSGQFFDTLSSTTPVLTVSSPAPPNSTTFTYTAPSGSNVSYTVNYTLYTVKTGFGVTGVNEYGPLSNALISGISLPDGSGYTFSYEQTPGSCTPLNGTYTANCVTGRIAAVVLPTGGEITYAYSGGSNGIESDGSTASLTRTLTPGGQWQYARTQVSGAHWQTQVTSPPDAVNAGSASDVTVIDFQEDGNTLNATHNFYPTQQLAFQGSTSGTLLATTIVCYNGHGVTSPSTCASTAVSSPVLRTTVFTQLPNASGVQSETDTTINANGLRSEVDNYDYGSGQVGSLVRKTITNFASLGNGIVDHPSSVVVEDSGNNVKGSTTYSYDAGTPTQTSGTPQHIAVSGSRGLLTSVAAQANGTTTLYRAYTYYDTGNLATSTDVSTSSTTHGAQTTYNYGSGSCGNSFVTSISEPLSLSRSMTWSCTGGVLLSLTDENGNTSSTAYSGSNYSNVFWRPYSTTDNAGTTTDYFYSLNSADQQFQTESKYASAFNSGTSIVDIVTTNDGFGRNIFQQTRQGPSATSYDTVATCYDSFGRMSETTLPYSAAEVTSNSQSCSGGAATSYMYDALNRTFSVTDGGGGIATYQYSENDVLQTLTSPTRAKQQEYDGLGRPKSVCEVTSGTSAFPGASCKQNTTATGYLTQYAYDLLGDLTNVTQNAQASSGTQTRGYQYDMLGRLISETNPETNNHAVTYSYDSLSSDAACGTVSSAGNKLKRLDAAGNATCYSGYDALHRVGSVIYPSTSTPASYFVYDTASLNGTTMSNAKTLLAEAYTCTGTCTGKLTDLFFSYWPTGSTTDVWELTPHSGSGNYYHVTSQPWPNGAINTLSNLSGLPTITYSTDGEGRMSTVTASGTTNPLASLVGYDPAAHVTGYTLGSSDNDSFTFYSNTGRMHTYTFSIGASPQTDGGTLNWNSNGSLQQLVINDQPNPLDSQTCNYTHDDLGRVASANCGASTWSQTFAYDPFGNITKTVPQGATGISFQPTYDYTNNTNRITSSPFTYNGNDGAMTEDQWHSYGWDTENRVTSVDSGSSSGVCQTYDALGRVVELGKGSSCASSEEVVYSPTGQKLALMNGSNLVKAFIQLPGGAQALYSSSQWYYRHPDWLASSRMTSTSSRSLYYGGAYAPFGENYVGTGTQDLSFTGKNQDTEPSGAGGAGGLYDFLYREHSPVQGRWLSPDPSGLAAVNRSDPQSWNRYAYVGNRPLSTIDPLGLDDDPPFNCLIDTGPPCDGLGPWFGPGTFCMGVNDVLCSLTPFGSGWPGGGGGFAPGDETGTPTESNGSPALGLGGLLGLLPGLNCNGSDSGGFGFTSTGSSNSSAPCIVLLTMPATIGNTPDNAGETDSLGNVLSCTHAPPLPSSSGACEDYGNEIYRGVSLQCFCLCAGDSAWSQQVRGCLACESGNGADPTLAHAICWSSAKGVAPVGTLWGCYQECRVGPI